MKKKIIIAILILFVLGVAAIFICPAIYNSKNAPKVVILSYHHFLSEEDKNKTEKENEYVVSSENFEEQLKFLKENKYESMTTSELECWMKKECKFKSKKVLITIDDGNISSYYIALPLLEKYGYNSVNFIIGSRVGEKSSEWKTDKYYFIGKDLIEEIRENHPLMEIGAHSYNLHNKINGVSPLELLDYEELLDDTKKVKEILNTEIYCFPFGRYDEKLIKTLKANGFKMAFTFKPSAFISQEENIYKLSRVEVRGSYDIKRFEEILTNKKDIIRYWKDIVKNILNIS